MRPRHPSCSIKPGAPRPLPTRWLMTDERMGNALWQALRRLPRGGGVIFRHYSLPPAARVQLFARVRRVALAHGLVLIRAGTMRMLGEDGVHGCVGSGLITWPVHSVRQARQARMAGAHAVFVSPVFATRSHPGAAALGVRRARAIGHAAGVPIIALGGMNETRFRAIHGFYGYAAIDGWLP